MQGNTLRIVLLSTILLFLLVAPLSATLSATYTPDAPIQLDMAPGIFTHPNLFGARLGRLEITSTQPLYNPTILVTGMPSGYDVVLIGPHRWDSDASFINLEIEMNVLAVSYPNGPGGPIFTRAVDDKRPLFDWSGVEVTVNPFIVDIYLVNSNVEGLSHNYNLPPSRNTNGGEFKLDSLYVFKHQPFAPHFTIGITDTIDQGPYVFPATGEPTQGQFIPIDGNVGQGTTPVVDPSGATTDPDDGSSGFWHGDIIPDPEPEPVQFFFSFMSDTVSFDLNDAYGGKRKEINTANMEVVNGETGQTYKQKITFTDSGDATNFQLKSSNGTVSTIDFDLFWGSSNNVVPYGEPIDWEGLAPGINTKQLWIGEINESAVAQRLSGIYIDTIYVNISAAD